MSVLVYDFWGCKNRILGNYRKQFIRGIPREARISELMPKKQLIRKNNFTVKTLKYFKKEKLLILIRKVIEGEGGY